MNGKDGGPAFPQTIDGNSLLSIEEGKVSVIGSGMSLRDWFAGRTITGLVSSVAAPWNKPKVMARMAYEQADAMLEARGKEESKT